MALDQFWARLLVSPWRETVAYKLCVEHKRSEIAPTLILTTLPVFCVWEVV